MLAVTLLRIVASVTANMHQLIGERYFDTRLSYRYRVCSVTGSLLSTAEIQKLGQIKLKTQQC